VASGCGANAGNVEPPDDALARYVEAIRTDDADTAYALLDEDTQAELTLDEFKTLMRQNEREIAEQVSELARLLGEDEGVAAWAHVPLASGETVLLVLEDGRWRVDGGVLDAPALRTPRDAVAALRRALSRRSLRGVERVLARQPRAEMEAEIGRILEETADELDLDIEIRGNSARVRTTGGREILLVREAGEWRILEIR
jgi:hypothetical protein